MLTISDEGSRRLRAIGNIKRNMGTMERERYSLKMCSQRSQVCNELGGVSLHVRYNLKLSRDKQSIKAISPPHINFEASTEA